MSQKSARGCWYLVTQASCSVVLSAQIGRVMHSMGRPSDVRTGCPRMFARVKSYAKHDVLISVLSRYGTNAFKISWNLSVLLYIRCPRLFRYSNTGMTESS